MPTMKEEIVIFNNLDTNKALKEEAQMYAQRNVTYDDFNYDGILKAYISGALAEKEKLLTQFRESVEEVRKSMQEPLEGDELLEKNITAMRDNATIHNFKERLLKKYEEAKEKG